MNEIICKHTDKYRQSLYEINHRYLSKSPYVLIEDLKSGEIVLYKDGIDKNPIAFQTKAAWWTFIFTFCSGLSLGFMIGCLLHWILQ